MRGANTLPGDAETVVASVADGLQWREQLE